jgi:alpha-beta hydrolase superfamily lysophospholipase
MNYQEDKTWVEMQKYLPVANRISEQNKPEEYFIELDNFKVHIDHYKVNNPKAIVIMLHGVGGNGRLLSCFALPLARNGYEVICPDLPLYGYTYCKSDKHLITYADWITVGSGVIKHYQSDQLPMFIFGASAGGMLAYQLASISTEIKGIMVTCLLDQRNRHIRKKTVKYSFMALLADLFLPLISKAMGSFRIPLKSISNMKTIANNKEVVRLLLQDPRSSGVRIPLAFVNSMLNFDLQIEPENFIQCPCLLLHPEQDKWTDLALSKIFFDRLACAKELQILEGAGHFPIEPIGLEKLVECYLNFIEEIV